MVLNSMDVHNFHCQMVNGVKMLFLKLILVLPCMLIIEKNNTLVLGEAPTDESDDATITAAENILLILPPQKKKIV